MPQPTAPNNSNSFNDFLLDLSESLIESLKDNPKALDPLLSNRLFMSKKVASDARGLSKQENTILTLTQELLEDLSILDDYLDMGMKTEEEYSEEKENTIADYLEEAVPLITACTITDEGHKNPDFEAEYAATSQRVMRKIMPIHTAEAALLEWGGSIQESYLQNSLIRMRFGYLQEKTS